MARFCYWIILSGIIPAVVAAEDGVVVQHSPDQTGGWASDTDYPALGGSGHSQLLADDFIIEAHAVIRQVTWWAHYGVATPPANETIRIRFYGNDPSNGLPGSILAESTLLNPLRESTGLLVSFSPGGNGLLPEYRFQADLTSPISLDSNTPYWIEIAQIGDSAKRFAWEFAASDQNGFAFANPADAEWQQASLDTDLAFELSTVPEPATLALVILAFGATRGTKRLNTVF